jgi:hypothetical protein
MKIGHCFGHTLLIAAAASMGKIHSMSAAETKSPSAPAITAVTNTIPQSNFVMPATQKEGRDPFYPDSERPYANLNAGPKQPVQTKISSTALVFNGVSGPPDHRLAIINGKTLAEGEEAEINTVAGRLTVHCVEIKTESVVIDVGNERRELRLRGN